MRFIFFIDTPLFSTSFASPRAEKRNKASKFKRAFSAWSVEEDRALIKSYKSHNHEQSILHLAKRHERSIGGIEARLRILKCRK